MSQEPASPGRDRSRRSGRATGTDASAGGQVMGVLGVIGPTRMAYDRVIPVVQAAADALGEAFGGDPAR